MTNFFNLFLLTVCLKLNLIRNKIDLNYIFPLLLLKPFSTLQNCQNTHTPDYSLLNSIFNFDFVVTIVIVQMCLAFKKGLSRSLDLD